MAKPVVGVDLGGTKILVRLIDPKSGAATGREKASTPTGGPDAVLDKVVDLVERLDGFEDAVAVGVGVPGPVDPDGVVNQCPNIAGWSQPVAVGKKLSKRLGLPVVVSNDVNCGAVAEHRLGAGKGSSEMLAIFVGTGVGGGLVLDNKLVVGPRGMVGEIGHMTVVPGGRACGCGGHGHLETYAGRAGMSKEAIRRAERDGPNFLTRLVGDGAFKSRHIAAGLEANDPVTRELVAQAADALALAIGNTATLLDLPLVVLGGGVIDRLGDSFLDQIATSAHFGGAGSDFVSLQRAARISDAGSVGAALLAIQ